jgi:hypothetical protein
MNALELLDRAAEIVERRRAEYGDPVELFEDVARRWSVMLGTDVTPPQAVLCQLDLKLSRLARDPRPAETAEVAEAERDQDLRSAEVLLNRAEVDRSIK